MNFFNSFTLCDAPEFWQLNIQDPATPIAEGMIFFHNYLLLFICFIAIFVFWMLYYVICTFSYSESNNLKIDKFTHSSLLEIIWTLIPAFLLIFIAIPSFSLLYSLDEIIDPSLTLKVVGHQWYWSYEYSDFVTLEGGEALLFDSYMLSTNDLSKGALRLLEVDNRLILPANTHIRVLITSADVLHSWAIPSFGVKIDACPGRLSQLSLFIKREGTFYGQCSEICGINHGFMPIVVKVTSVNLFTEWVAKKLETLVF